MRTTLTILMFVLLALVPLSCGGSEDPGTTAKLCCDGACGAPAGYCHSENHCNGACPETALLWDTEKKAPAAPAAPDADSAENG